MSTPCFICIQNPEVKTKPGIFPCLGCKQMFCAQHATFHRQELSNQLEIVTSDRNELQATIDRQKNMINVSVQMKLIDEWVKKSVEQIHQVADNVRQQITCLAEEQKTIFKDQFSQLTKQLDSFRDDENYFEHDIKRLQANCVRLKHLLDLADVKIITTDIRTALEKVTIVRQEDDKVVQAVQRFTSVEDIVTNRKPDKRVRIPHDGSIYLLEDFIVIHNKDDFTLMNLQTNLLESFSIFNSRFLVMCSSTYINGLLCIHRDTNSKIQLLKIGKQDPILVEGFSPAIRSFQCMVCFEDRMVLVCQQSKYPNSVQEWSLKDFNTLRRATSPLFTWETPLTCAANELIDDVSFNDKQIVFLITSQDMPSRNRIEFRSRNMNMIGHLLFVNAISKSSILCCLTDKFLFGGRKNSYDPWHFTLIDDKLVRHEQKILSKYGVKQIDLVKFESNLSVLAIYREDKAGDKVGDSGSRLFLDLYHL